MKREIFVDTSGFYALLIAKDGRHVRARQALERAAALKRGFLTSDYVLDETATLLQARGHAHLGEALFRVVFESSICRVAWMDPDRFSRTRAFFTKHSDQPWSFTDCFSFVLMQEHALSEALSTDIHFEHAGFTPLLA